MSEDTGTTQDEPENELQENSPKPKPKEGVLTVTQEELDRMMAKNRRNLTRQNEEMAKKLETMQSQYQLTAEANDELSQTIESLRTQTMTQEELAKREAKKLKDQFKTENERLLAEANEWKTRYEKETIRRELLDAANQPDYTAYEPDQIVQILGTNTYLAKVKDEESGDERLEVKVKYQHQDDEGKPKTLEISPSEAVKLMSETSRHANLFVPRGSPGLGGTRNASQEATPDMSDMDSYVAWHAKNKTTVLN